MSTEQHGVNTRPDFALAEEETAKSETLPWQHIYIQAAVVWLLMHDFGLNRWWLWDFQLGPAPGCWGSIIEPRWRWRAPVIHQRAAYTVEGATHRSRCWLKVWCTTKLGPGRRRIRLVDAHAVHVLLFPARARGAARSQS